MVASKGPADVPARRESPPRPRSASADKLIDPALMAASTANSTFAAGADHIMSIDTRPNSPPLLHDIDITSPASRSHHMHNQGLTDNDPTSPSSLLRFSPHDSSSDLNTDHILDAFHASIPSDDSIFTTFYESLHSHGCGTGDKKGNTASDCMTIAATSSSSSSGVNPRPDDHGGWQSPLHIAAAKGHDRIVHILLQHVIDCDEADSDGLTPLIHATAGGYAEVVSSLLSHGASVAAVDRQHRSALHWAVLHRREGVLKILLDWCAARQTAIDIYDEAGMTPLHTAVDMGYDAGVQLLLQLGANAQYRTRKRK